MIVFKEPILPPTPTWSSKVVNYLCLLYFNISHVWSNSFIIKPVGGGVGLGNWHVLVQSKSATQQAHRCYKRNKGITIYKSFIAEKKHGKLVILIVQKNDYANSHFV